MKVFKKRYDMAMTAMHFAAVLLSPSLKSIVTLKNEEKNCVLEFIEDHFSIGFFSIFLKFSAGLEYFKGAIMDSNHDLNDYNWWKLFASLHVNLISDVLISNR